MSRFSPAYKRDDPFTLFEGVRGAAQALTKYTLGKRQMGREDAEDTRRQERHERIFDRDKKGDERYEDERDNRRGNEAARRYREYGEVEGVENIPPSGPVTDYGPAEGTAADALGGGVAQMPTLQGEATTLGQALEQSIVSDELKPMGSGIPGDWNSQAFQVDGAIPVPGVPGRFLMPQSGKQIQLEGEIARLADQLAQSESRTGFAGEAGSEERMNESRIQARVSVQEPYEAVNRKRQSEGRGRGGGGPTYAQERGERQNQSEVIYKQAIDQGRSPSEALSEAMGVTGVAPDAGFMQQVGNNRLSRVDRHRDDYGTPDPGGITAMAEEMILNGASNAEVLDWLVGQGGLGPVGPKSQAAPGTTAADSVLDYIMRKHGGKVGRGRLSERVPKK